MKFYAKLIGTITLSFFLIACGSSASDQKKALTKISNYSAQGSNAPTIDLYEDAGLIGVNSRNIDFINSFVNSSAYDDLDTKEELQSKITILGKFRKTSLIDSNETEAPTKEDFIALGIRYIETTSDEDLLDITRTISLSKDRSNFLMFKREVEKLLKFFNKNLIQKRSQ